MTAESAATIPQTRQLAHAYMNGGGGSFEWRCAPPDEQKRRREAPHVEVSPNTERSHWLRRGSKPTHCTEESHGGGTSAVLSVDVTARKLPAVKPICRHAILGVLCTHANLKCGSGVDAALD